MNNTNTKFRSSNLPMHNKFGMHMPPVYRVVKPSEVPADKVVNEEGLEYSDVCPLEWSTSSFTHEDASNNNTTTVPSTFVLSDYIRKP
jgi:hypothetical protein